MKKVTITFTQDEFEAFTRFLSPMISRGISREESVRQVRKEGLAEALLSSLTKMSEAEAELYPERVKTERITF